MIFFFFYLSLYFSKDKDDDSYKGKSGKEIKIEGLLLNQTSFLAAGMLS